MSNESKKVIKIENERLSVKSDLSKEDRCHVQRNFYEYRKTISLNIFETSFKIKYKISKSLLIIKRLKLLKVKSFKFIEKRKINTIKRLKLLEVKSFKFIKKRKISDIKSAFIFNMLNVLDLKDNESKENTFIKIRKLCE